MPPRLATAVRALAGLVTLTLWWRGAKRLTQPRQAMWLHALAAVYLMLFNPMNEANSYVILAPALAFWTTSWLADPVTASRGWVLAAMILAMGLLPNLVRPLFGNHFALICHPAITLIFGVLLTLQIWRPAGSAASANPAEPSTL